MVNNEMQEEIEKKIKTALDSNKLYAFLLGIGVYKIPAGNMNRDLVLNTGAIMRAIYNYCRNVSNIGLEVQKNLEIISNIKTFDAVYAALDIVSYQLNSEKNNTSPFKLDNKKILEILNKNITTNLNFYKGQGNLGNFELANGIFPLIQSYDNDLNDNYDLKVL